MQFLESLGSTLIKIDRHKTFSMQALHGAHYLMGLGPNTKKIPQNSGKQIRIPEGM